MMPKKDKILAARDPMGIRPMFYGYHKEDGKICFASEAKGLFPLCQEIMPFPPGIIMKMANLFVIMI